MVVPIGQAMIICDAVWRDPATGKTFILGAFANIATINLPAVLKSVCVYVAITDCHGETPLNLNLVYVNPETMEDEEVGRWEQTLTIPDPLIVAEGQFVLQGLEFPHGGEYRFQLESGGEPILERRITVEVKEQNHGQ